MSDSTLSLVIKARDEATHVIDKMSGAIGHLGSKAAALTPLAGAVTALGGAFSLHEAISTASELGTEIIRLQRETGLTAEGASKLRFEFQETGVSFESGEKGIKKFSSALAGVSDLADGVTIPVGKQMQQLLADVGVQGNDAAGAIRPLTDVLGDVAEKFKTMGPGADSTALSVKLFGKSGMDMLPFLFKGRDGLKELSGEASKFGLVLDQKTLDAMKRQKQASREFHAALQGISVQIGVALLPVMTQMAVLATHAAVVFNSQVVPAIRAAADWLGGKLAPVFAAVGDAAGNLADLLGSVLTGDIEGAALAFAQLPGPLQDLVLTLHSLYLKALTTFDFFKTDVVPVLQDLGNAIKDKLSGPLSDLIGLIARHKAEVAAFVGALAVNSILALAAAFGVWAISAGAAAVATVIALAPVIALAAVIGLLGVAIFEVVKHHDAIKDKILEVWGAVADFVSDKLGYLKDVVVFAFRFYLAEATFAFDSIRNVIETAIAVVRDVINIVLALIRGDWGAAWGGIKDLAGDIWNGIVAQVGISIDLLQSMLSLAWDVVKWGAATAWAGISSVILGVWDGIKAGIQAALNWVIDKINNFADGVNSATGWLGSIGVNVPQVPTIPHVASGGTFSRGGLALVGERGPELAIMPGGATVVPADATRALLDWLRGNGKAGEQSPVVQHIYVSTIEMHGDPAAGLASLGMAV